jgi:hypothetical protein
MAGAALPWANTLQPTVNPAVDNHLPETLGLTVGTSKIEVLWLMTSEDDEGNEMEYEQVCHASSYATPEPDYP